MSNYNCPQCNEPIIDSPGGPHEEHKCKYVPYSTRHNITDKELAGLLDYCERDIGWEIQENEWFDGIVHTYDLGKATFQLWDDEEVQFLYGELDLRIPYGIFIFTYRTLLPVIRDLYSKT